MSTPPTLLAVPNVSEGRDEASIAAIGRAFATGPSTRLLDRHSDPDHGRTVFTLAGVPGGLAAGLLAGAAETVGRVDVGPGRVPERVGLHPHVGALDVAPVVYLDLETRGAACAEALLTADGIAHELEVPVLLYGALAGGRTRAELRRGGLGGLTRRLEAGELKPDFGPARPHPTAGVTLVGAREPLVAFNLELAAPATPADARAIAARIREGGVEGLPGLRAIGIALRGGEVGQVSMNVERPLELPLAEVIRAVGAHARISRAELVGLAPRGALEGFPEDLPMPGFDRARHVIENGLGL